MSCAPIQKFCFPDGTLKRADQVYAASSQGEACIPSVVPSAGNCGTLSPSVSGSLDYSALSPGDDPFPWEIEVVESGKPGQAGYTYLDALANVRVGMDDPGIMTLHNSPFPSITTAPMPDTGQTAFGTTVAYHTATKRLLYVAPHESDGTITIRYRTIDASPFVLSTVILDPTTLTPPAPALDPNPSVTNQKAVAIVEAPNGTLLMAYYYVQTPAPSPTWQVALLKSEDGGLTWSLLHTKMHQRTNSTNNDRGMRIARSGPWVRLMYFAGSETHERASRDSGLSWEDEVYTGGVALPNSAISSDDWPYDLVGVGDGLFLWVFANLPATSWTYRIARGTDAWAAIGGLAANRSRSSINSTSIVGLGGCVAWGRVWVFVQTEDGGGSAVDDNLSVYFQDPALVSSKGPGNFFGAPDEWRPYETMGQQRGTRFFPHYLSAVSCGDQFIALHGARWNIESAAQEPGSFGVLTGHLSPKPSGEQANNPSLGAVRGGPTGIYSEQLYAMQWAAPWARPANGPSASADTLWSESSGGIPIPPLIYWSEAAIYATANATQFLFHQIIDAGATTSDSWVVVGSEFGMIGALPSGSTVAAISHGMRIRSLTSAGTEVHLTVRMDTTTVEIWDENAGPPAAVVSMALNMVQTFLIKVALEEIGGGYRASLTGWNVADPSGTFIDTADAPLTAAAGLGDDRYQQGALAVGTAGVLTVRECWIVKNKRNAANLRERTTEPDFVYLGIPARGESVCLPGSASQGRLDLRWGGGASALGDTFELRECFVHNKGNVLQQSTLIGWRSGLPDPAAAAHLRFKADPAAEDPPVGFPNIASFLGVTCVILMATEDQTMFVDFAAVEDFSVIARTEPVTTTIFAGLIVLSASANQVTFIDAAGRRNPIEGELAGMRFKWASGPLVGQTFCIDDHCEQAAGIHVLTVSGVNLTDDLFVLGGGFMAGETFDVFTPFGVAIFPSGLGASHPFMQVRFEDTATCTGDHRLGAILPGCTVDVPVPLEWTHGDAETAEVVTHSGPGGVEWGYQSAPARRVWTGRVVNDYVRWRETMRYLLRSMTAYSTRPLAILPDSENHRSLIYGKVSQSNLENSFWWDRDDGDGEYRYTGGDMQVQVTEVP